jgi:hypothetical protein
VADVARDWHAWYDEYDDPDSSLSRRLRVVRAELARVLAERQGPVRLLSLCAGDGRDTLPVLAESAAQVSAVLVELDPELAESARRAAAATGLEVDVRTGDAGLSATWRDIGRVDVLMLCGVLGNVRDDDARRTLAAAPLLVRPPGTLIWTRGAVVPEDPTGVVGDPSEWVRRLLLDAGWEESAFIRPEDTSFRVGVHVWPRTSEGSPPDRLFAFV